MDSETREMISVVLMHKTTQIKVELPLSCTINELQKCVQEKTQIPESNQKLLYKGLCVSKTPEKSLQELKLKSGGKIMVIGQVFHPEEQTKISKLEEIEKQVESIKNTITEITKNYDSIDKGFIDNSMKKEAISKVSKNCTSSIEKLMKLLETIDGIIIENKFESARNKRKRIVDSIQPLLDKCDILNDKIEAVL